MTAWYEKLLKRNEIFCEFEKTAFKWLHFAGQTVRT